MAWVMTCGKHKITALEITHIFFQNFLLGSGNFLSNVIFSASSNALYLLLSIWNSCNLQDNTVK